jgi:hypothetical protein
MPFVPVAVHVPVVKLERQVQVEDPEFISIRPRIVEALLSSNITGIIDTLLRGARIVGAPVIVNVVPPLAPVMLFPPGIVIKANHPTILNSIVPVALEVPLRVAVKLPS